jgi:hypothetical protein
MTVFRKWRLLFYHWRKQRRDKMLEPGTWERPKKWGLWDRDDKCWMGYTHGPLTYGPHWVARFSARIVAARLDYSPLRIQVRRYPRQNVVKRDTIEPLYSAEEAFRRIEEGLTL